MPGTVTGSPDTAVLAVMLGLLHADAPEQIAGNPQAWPRWAVLLPHVLTAAGHAGHLPAKAQEAAGPDTAWLLDRAASYLLDLGQAAEARPLAERALTITEAAYGPDHPIVATELSNLALILQDLGLTAEARPLAERALTIDEAAYGPDHPDVAICLSNLAMILKDLGQGELPGGQAKEEAALRCCRHPRGNPQLTPRPVS